MRAFVGNLVVCALVGAFADEANTDKTKLDPAELKGLELYVFAKGPDDKESCYEIIVAERIAQGKDGIGQSNTECKDNWSEQIDFGNYNGENMEKYGQHYTGGSKRGCSAWLKMYADDSLSKAEATITYDDEYCETNIIISGPSKLLVQPAQTEAAEDESQSKETEGVEEFDPVDYRYKELYVLGSDKLCYQIIIGARIAQGKPDIGQSADECKENWSEQYDLGNWDGSSIPDYGQHYAGGSRRGCQLWLKMFDDSSLSAIDAKITDEECEYQLTLSGPRSLFDALPKAAPHAPTVSPQADSQKKVTDQFAVSTSALRQQTSSPDASSSPSSPLLAFGAAAVGLIAVGACVVQLRRRKAIREEGEPAE
mmetsp:Transcript_74446/g.187589  ORF Transcript_74446/g.187589 Transcript_74446/m.187589 type:complete len:368 (+) Transcript_74446:60-1163(+)|eukprot:CAMPEP_0115214392 /NCGR_PEP_ID=MMETSP0270-20121206/24283_1 /TAXON_ID=71861 /ORGANISM="Scrippsiella trochoidea, Strain CCMP3099" /LENGTH=367 /DNA_ID=CAMNT_0002628165 /DNA_START=55 /DNA_END=1158 /DNA_ORIENTATION=-